MDQPRSCLQLTSMKCVVHLTSMETPAGLTRSLVQARGEFHLVTVETGDSVPQLCLEINRSVNEVSAGEAHHAVLIASGLTCLDLPTIARAQAALHRSVISYALISPVFPVSTDQWPNAPVTVYLPADQDPERSVSLRGFQVVHFDSPEDLSGLIVRQIETAQ